VIYGDIRELTADTNRNGLQEQRAEQQTSGDRQLSKIKCDILTGGFPCQPFSQAGKRKGKDDNRYLWPEMLRVIRSFQPTWVIAENVRGILTIEGGMVFEQVCLDLETEGYEVQPLIIPAVAVNAPHRRDRVWFVAHRKRREVGNEHRLSRDERRQESTVGGEGIQHKNGQTQTMEYRQSSSNAPDTRPQYGQPRNGEGVETDKTKRSTRTEANKRFSKDSWSESWHSVAIRTCSRGVDDGLPAELDGLKLSKSKHRVERLKALGNAIVPQVAVEIMKAIALCSGKEE